MHRPHPPPHPETLRWSLPTTPEFNLKFLPNEYSI
ncbi:hypothetical protein QE390_003571 [Siphonobacter sp. SORGH_AS 1065]|nr:hypothetical protein [Siphonobacter sp. SORGH_AS_1065]